MNQWSLNAHRESVAAHQRISSAYTATMDAVRSEFTTRLTQRANLLKLLIKLCRMSSEDHRAHLEQMREVKADNDRLQKPKA